jgi:hypothetical protein
MNYNHSHRYRLKIQSQEQILCSGFEDSYNNSHLLPMDNDKVLDLDQNVLIDYDPKLYRNFSSHLLDSPVDPDVEIYFSSLCNEETKEEKPVTRFLQSKLGLMLNGKTKSVLKLNCELFNNLSCILNEVFGKSCLVLHQKVIGDTLSSIRQTNYIKRCFHVVPMFVENSMEDYEKAKRIFNLGQKIQKENKNDVLTWLYQGYQMKDVSVPSIVTNATVEALKTDLDNFIDDYCVLTKDAVTKSLDVFLEYKRFIRELYGYRSLSITYFLEELLQKHNIVCKNKMLYGIKLKPEEKLVL